MQTGTRREPCGSQRRRLRGVRLLVSTDKPFRNLVDGQPKKSSGANRLSTARAHWSSGRAIAFIKRHSENMKFLICFYSTNLRPLGHPSPSRPRRGSCARWRPRASRAPGAPKGVFQKAPIRPRGANRSGALQNGRGRTPAGLGRLRRIWGAEPLREIFWLPAGLRPK